MYQRFLSCFILWTLFSANAVIAAPFGNSWHIRDLLSTDQETVELRDKNGRFLKTLDTGQLLKIYAVLKAIEKAAEVNSELIIVDGKVPNAFAFKTQGRLLSEEEIAKKRAERQDSDASVVRPSFDDEANSSETFEETNTVAINVVGINFAMLAMLANDMHMVAALIGHELGHIVLDHGEASKHKPRPGTAAASTAAATKYSRDNERQSDYIGTVWMVEAGFDPQGAVRLQELLYKSSKHRSGAFVGSHPSSTERIAILKSLARRLAR